MIKLTFLLELMIKLTFLVDLLVMSENVVVPRQVQKCENLSHPFFWMQD
jgi:hypothetical protein